MFDFPDKLHSGYLFVSSFISKTYISPCPGLTGNRYFVFHFHHPVHAVIG